MLVIWSTQPKNKIKLHMLVTNGIILKNIITHVCYEWNYSKK